MKSCVNAELVLIDSDAAGGAVVANSMKAGAVSSKWCALRAAKSLVGASARSHDRRAYLTRRALGQSLLTSFHHHLLSSALSFRDFSPTTPIVCPRLNVQNEETGTARENTKVVAPGSLSHVR